MVRLVTPRRKINLVIEDYCPYGKTSHYADFLKEELDAILDPAAFKLLEIKEIELLPEENMPELHAAVEVPDEEEDCNIVRAYRQNVLEVAYYCATHRKYFHEGEGCQSVEQAPKQDKWAAPHALELHSVSEAYGGEPVYCVCGKGPGDAIHKVPVDADLIPDYRPMPPVQNPEQLVLVTDLELGGES